MGGGAGRAVMDTDPSRTPGAGLQAAAHRLPSGPGSPAPCLLGAPGRAAPCLLSDTYCEALQAVDITTTPWQLLG